jgi:excinuclease UvrABC nuclease subunit
MYNMKTVKVDKDRMTKTFGKAGRAGGRLSHFLYMCKNRDGDIIRIGATQNLNDRFNQYKNAGPRHGEWANDRIWDETFTVDYEEVESREVLLQVERRMIEQYQPIYNRYLK